jgi:hypothetical protein
VADEYKALTVVHLPFIEETFQPGATIPWVKFEEMATLAAAAVDDRTGEDADASPLPTAEGVIEELMKYGSLSDDLDAPLHPDHIPVAPGAVTAESVVANAKFLIERLTEAGKEVPAELQELAEMDMAQISADLREILASDQGSGESSA